MLKKIFPNVFESIKSLKHPNKSAGEGLIEIIKGVIDGDSRAIAAAVLCVAIILVCLFSVFG